MTDESAMRSGVTSDNIQLSEPKIESVEAFAVDCNRSSSSQAVPFAVDCNQTALAARFAVDCNSLDATALGCGDPEVLRFVAAATSPNTRRAYQSDIMHFLTWGGTIPADPGLTAQYLAYHASILTPATLARRLVGIRRAHLDRGLNDPTKADLVRTVLRGIRRVCARPQRRVAPLIAEELFAICGRLGDSVRDIRDRALLLVGFAGAFRRSELVALDFEDVEPTGSGIVVNIRRSKTDQEGQGRKIVIPIGSAQFCPVSALEQWLAVANIAEGPVFRPVSRAGKVMARRLSAEAVASIVKDRIKSLGRDPSRYSGHSLRAGFASSAALAGVPSWRIRAQTGHRSDATLHFISERQRHQGNPKTPLWRSDVGPHDCASSRRRGAISWERAIGQDGRHVRL
jgi:integrase